MILIRLISQLAASSCWSGSVSGYWARFWQLG